MALFLKHKRISYRPSVTYRITDDIQKAPMRRSFIGNMIFSTYILYINMLLLGIYRPLYHLKSCRIIWQVHRWYSTDANWVSRFCSFRTSLIRLSRCSMMYGSFSDNLKQALVIWHRRRIQSPHLLISMISQGGEWLIRTAVLARFPCFRNRHSDSCSSFISKCLFFCHINGVCTSMVHSFCLIHIPGGHNDHRCRFLTVI